MTSTIGIDLGPLIVDTSTVTFLDYCTVAEVEAYSGVDFTQGVGPSQTQIGTMITNASRIIDAYAGVQIAGTVTATEYFDVSVGLQHIVLTKRPVASITSIHEVKDDGSETLMVQGRTRNTDDYFLHDDDAGIVQFIDPFTLDERQAIKVVYVSGNSTIPAIAKMATILLVVRNAARAALNDENNMERVKEMWKGLLASTEQELKEYIALLQEDAPVQVATFGLKGAY